MTGQGPDVGEGIALGDSRLGPRCQRNREGGGRVDWLMPISWAKAQIWRGRGMRELVGLTYEGKIAG